MVLPSHLNPHFSPTSYEIFQEVRHSFCICKTRSFHRRLSETLPENKKRPMTVSFRSGRLILKNMNCCFGVKKKLRRMRLCCSLFAVRCSLFAVRCSLFAVRCSLFAVRCSLFAVRCSLFAKDSEHTDLCVKWFCGFSENFM